MLRITRGEESKLTSWYFEIDRSLLVCVLGLVAVGIFTLLTAGAAEATRMGHPWFYFIQKAFVPYMLGLICLFGFSMLNKKLVIKISAVGLVLGLIALLFTYIHPMRINGSIRWVSVSGFSFMPADIIKPFFIMVTAWFLSVMHKKYGSDIFSNKEAWQLKRISWIPYFVIFSISVLLILLHPDLGTAALYVGILGVMLFVAGLPLKWLSVAFGGLAGLGVIGITFLPQLAHVRERIGNMFFVQPRTQAWYSLNSIKHGGLFGVGTGAYVQDVLPESTNDFVYSAFAEVWGALIACALVVLLFVILNNLIKHAISARDDFVVYAVAGAAALFGGQICFNLMTALHLVIDKGMTLPFVSYGGVSFITFCILFGMVFAIVREDTWGR